MMQGADLLLEIFLSGLGITDAGGFVFALANQGLANEIGAGLAAPGISGLGGGFLESFQLILDFLHFTFFDGAIGSVKDAVSGFLIDGIDFHAGAIRVHRNEDKTNGNGALVSRLQEVAGCNRVFANFKIDVAGALPGIEERSGVDDFCAVQNWLLVEDQRAMNDLVAGVVSVSFGIVASGRSIMTVRNGAKRRT